MAHRAFHALNEHDSVAFAHLCDTNVEVYRFVAPSAEAPEASYAMVPLVGAGPVASWLADIFTAFPNLGFRLDAVDPIGASMVCDAKCSFNNEPPRPWTFVLTIHHNNLIGFEV